MFPSNWSSRVTTTRKKRVPDRTSPEEYAPPTQKSRTHGPPEEPNSGNCHSSMGVDDPVAADFDVCRRVMASINAGDNLPFAPEVLSLDNLLSRCTPAPMLWRNPQWDAC